MNRSLILGSALALSAAWLGACSSGDPAGSTANPGTAGSTSGTSGSGGAASGTAGATTAGSSNGSGGSSTAGASSGGTAGAGGGFTNGGAVGTAGTTNAGASGQATGGSGGGAGGTSGGTAGGGTGGGGTGGGAATHPPEGPFTCTQYIGAYLSMEWWNQGFQQQPGIDDAKWQLKWHHHGTIGNWGDPNSPFWSDQGDPQDDSKGAPIQSACTTNSNAPDRIVMLIIEWDLITQAAWVEQIEKIVTNLKAKYPSAKRIELMTTVRVAGNKMCNPDANYGPGANASAGREDCYIPPYADAAIAQVIAAHPELLAAGPQIEAPMCGPSVNGPHLGGENDKLTAKAMGLYYSTRL